MISQKYAVRIEALRRTKETQTREKIVHNGYMNEDDYGTVLPPEDFTFQTEFNDEINHTFYGAKLWGRNFRRLLERHPVYVDPNDALAGRWMFILQRFRPFTSATSSKNMEMAPEFNYDWLRPLHEKYQIIPGIGKMHHFGPDYQIGLDLGFGGLLDKVRHYAEKYPEKSEFYHAEEDVLFGMRCWMQRTVDEIRRKKDAEKDPELKENLQEMLEANEWLIDHPPRNFREACQFIAWINMGNRTYNRAGSGMQLDTILLPYYLRDIENHILDDDKAVYILTCLLINDPIYCQIGGPDPAGKDMTTHLSFLILEAAHQAKTSVNLTIRYHEGLDPALLQRGVEILFEDRKAYPRFSGNDALVSGFMKNGYSAELARQRIAVGCHWMSLPGLEYCLNDLIKINLAKIFEVAFQEMMEAGERSTDRLFELYTKHLDIAIQCVAEGIDFHLKNQYKNAPELMLNLLCHGPIEKGLDASHGGMPYYNIGVDAGGFATTADSFASLEQRIEKEKLLGWDECAEALKNNFEGVKGIRIQKLLKNAGHFGHGGTLGDSWAVRISADFTHRIVSRRTPDGYLMIPGIFTWANTVMMGEHVGATPNGRYAGTPVSHGANPDPGFRLDGALTAMSTAIASVQPGYGNTAPFQLELNPTVITQDDAVQDFIAVLKEHFRMGGTLLNVNIVDKEQILEANKNPETHPDLIVRVTGFTAYFAALSPEFRKLVVDRIVAM